jgi:hypothetical protein
VLTSGNKFVVAKDFFYVAKAVNNGNVDLMVSNSKSGYLKFIPAKIPTSLKDKNYTIVDSVEGEVFLHVNHSKH